MKQFDLIAASVATYIGNFCNFLVMFAVSVVIAIPLAFYHGFVNFKGYVIEKSKQEIESYKDLK